MNGLFTRLVWLILLFGIGTVCGFSQETEVKPGSYYVSVDLTHGPTAHVEAEVTVTDGLLMIGGSVDDRPRGWADFIRDLKIFDLNGHPLTLEEYSDAKYKTRWRVGDGNPGRIKLNYSVDLSLAKTKWPAGNEQFAYFDGEALFVATRIMFVVPSDTAPAEVSFTLPSGGKIASPWHLNSNGSYRTTGDQLVNDTIVFGKFGGFNATVGNFNFTVALLGDARKAEPIVTATLKKYAHAYTKLFDKTPRSSYMMTLFFADDEDGESYTDSAAFTTVPPITADNMIMWGNTLGHELFHFWCGQQIGGENYAESQWFQEGFTEYYANLAMMREKIMPESFFIWKMDHVLGKYAYFRTAPQFSKVALKNAGERKTTYRFGVYDGGWAIAFGLDMAIREKTGGRKSLDDFMRMMYDKYGLTGTKYKYSDVVAAASDISRSDMTDFFKRYVEGTEVLPVSSILAKVGYGSAMQDYADELYIYPLTSTPLKERWLGRQ